MFFSKLFKNIRKNKYDRDEFEEEMAGTRYADLETEQVTPDLNLTEGTSTKHYVVDLCEQMIDVSRELEDTRTEYQQVTNYLNDIQIIEDLPKEKKAALVECANHIAMLEKARTQFLETERRLSDTQYAQMQENEDELPGIIKRLKANETYLDAIKRDMSYLEGEKLECEMLRTNAAHRQKFTRKMSCYVLALYAAIIVLLIILMAVLEQDVRIPMMIATAVAAVLAVYMLVKYQDAGKDIKRSDVNRNHAVSLENHVKIKYVNIKNAVDYTCEKFHARDSRDLSYVYEQYQIEAKEKEKFRQTNDDLERYKDMLVHKLKAEYLYDAKVWLGHADAIVDSREMVELKHELITRRQKLRERIGYNMKTIADMRREALKYVDRMGESGTQVQMIIRKIEEISSAM